MHQPTTCTPGTNSRICTCPTNCTVNGTTSQSITLPSSTPFPGCQRLLTSVLADVCPICCYIDNSGESFTSTANEDLISVDFYLQGVSGWATGIYVEIHSGSFTGPILGTTPSVAFVASQPARWVTFTFLTPVRLVLGTTYYLKGVPGTGWTYTPNPGMCGNVYSGGISYLQGMAYSPDDYSLRITMTKHCGNGIVDTSYGEVCDSVPGCKSDCSGCTSGSPPTCSGISSAVEGEDASPSGLSSLPLTTIIGISIGAAAVFILIMVAIVVIIKKQSTTKEHHQIQDGAFQKI